MRFIFNFIFFGLLFFIIWQYFPDAFSTLVSWAASVFNFLKDTIQTIIHKLTPEKHSPEAPKVLFELGGFYLMAMRNWIK